MSGQAVSLQAEERTVVGKKVQTLRRNGFVPAVVYERGQKSDSIAILSVPMTKVWNEAGKHHAIELQYGSKQRLTFIKDVSYDPVKGSLTHISFHAIKKNEPIETEVPLHLEGLAPATVQGLIVRTNVSHVEVKGLPGNIPDSIVIDVTGIATADDDIRASQLVLPKDIELITDEDTVVVSVVIPRAEVESQSEEPAESEVPSDHGSTETK